MQGCELEIQKLVYVYTWIIVSEYVVKKWGPSFSPSEKGAINKERKKMTINLVMWDWD